MEPFLKDNNRVSLLTLPRSDLVVGNSTSGSTCESPGGTNHTKKDASSAALLLQLPAGWKPSGLRGARFVAGNTSSNDNSTSEPQVQQQAALVVEAKRCSFACLTVETSNAFILVPPVIDNSDDNHASISHKRPKVVRADGKVLQTVPARLLKRGGSGASFLELRAKTLRRTDLGAALQQWSAAVWDPYHSNPYSKQDEPPLETRGQTLEDLAASLQVSTAQVMEGLQQIPNALRLPSSSDPQSQQQQQQSHQQSQDRYVLVAEEALQECSAAILAALAEVDGLQDYAGADGVAVGTVVAEAVARMSTEQSFEGAEIVLEHCLRRLSSSGCSSINTRAERIRLDVGKVAVCVAHRLLRKESGVVDEAVFFETWQSELPGVGPRYVVHPDMLLGVAVLVGGDDDNDSDDPEPRQWKYLPADQLSMDPTACFGALFAVKERWRLRELEPYLERRLADDGTPAELLLRFTQMETVECDGVTTKFYLKK